MNRPSLRAALILLLLFLVTWLPRGLALDAYVSPDERKWLARSANFYAALAHGDFANTFQREHPGVTVMWAGTLGFLQLFPAYPQQAPGYFTWEREDLEAWLKENTPYTPLQLLAAGRGWVALEVTLALLACFFPLRRLLGSNAAYAAIFFLALSPFGVALSRQLHPDGLVSVLTFLALLNFLAWLYAGRRRRDLVISGVVMGLAWLTKTPAALLVPFGALLIGIELWHDARVRKLAGYRPGYESRHAGWQFMLLSYVLWSGVATATFFMLWPAMWADPIGTLVRMGTEMEAYVQGHVNPNYFLGQPTGDPGVLFYPIAYFFRSTPATLFGLAGALLAWLRRWWPLNDGRVRSTVFALTLFALVFIMAMTVPAKKFDRYILPAFLALDVVAVMGWLALVQLLWTQTGGKWMARLRRVPPAIWITGVLVVLHGLFTVANAPYYLTYFNPLAGGSWTAPRVLFTGWGEGLDEAARWLDEQPEAEELRAVSWYADGPFSYFFDGQAVPMGYSSPLSWLDVDYVVTYANQWQRQLPSPEAVAYFEEQTPVHTVRFAGLDLANVYDMKDVLIPPFIDFNTAAAADFGDQIRLVGHDLKKVRVAPGESTRATFYLQGRAPIDKDYNVLVRLVAPDGTQIWREEGWPWGAPTSGWPAREVRPDGHQVTIPAGTAPGLYALTLALYDPATLEPLAAMDARDGSPLEGNTRVVALIQVGESSPAGQSFDPPWTFDRFFALDGATLPPEVAAGETLTTTLHWESLDTTPTDYTTFVHVVAPDGTLVAQQDRPPLHGAAPTHTWAPGVEVDDVYAIPLPATLPAGIYTVRAGLYATDGQRLPVARGEEAAGDFAVAGEFVVP